MELPIWRDRLNDESFQVVSYPTLFSIPKEIRKHTVIAITVASFLPFRTESETYIFFIIHKETTNSW